MRTCLIFNEVAGRRRAARRLRGFLARHGQELELWPTQYAGHAVELARVASEAGFEMVAAAGGDGTAHEVANGILESNANPVLAIVPTGSANDYARSIARQFGVHPLKSGLGHWVDVGRISNGEADANRYFIEAAGAGLSGAVTNAARDIPFLQGIPLYGIAAWRALRAMGAAQLWRLRYDDEEPITRAARMASVMLGQREGGFPMAPDALLDDGKFDVVEVGAIDRWQAIRLLPRLAWCGPPSQHPDIIRRSCQKFCLEADEGLFVHADGEVLFRPEQNERRVQFEIFPRRLRVLVCEV